MSPFKSTMKKIFQNKFLLKSNPDIFGLFGCFGGVCYNIKCIISTLRKMGVVIYEL